MACILIALLTLAFSPWASAAKPDLVEGKLSIFRWNQGYRAERIPVFEGKMPEAEFRKMVKEGKLPESAETFAGCYLAHFEPAKSAERAPASAFDGVKPKSEVFRICRR